MARVRIEIDMEDLVYAGNGLVYLDRCIRGARSKDEQECLCDVARLVRNAIMEYGKDMMSGFNCGADVMPVASTDEDERVGADE